LVTKDIQEVSRNLNCIRKMSDRYYTKLICKKCGEELEQDMPLFVPVGEKVTIKCPKCKTKTQF
jgi:hypothetical protein